MKDILTWKFIRETRLEIIKILLNFQDQYKFLFRIAARQIQCPDCPVSRFNFVNIDWKQLTYFRVKSQQKRLRTKPTGYVLVLLNLYSNLGLRVFYTPSLLAWPCFCVLWDVRIVTSLLICVSWTSLHEQCVIWSVILNIYTIMSEEWTQTTLLGGVPQ